MHKKNASVRNRLRMILRSRFLFVGDYISKPILKGIIEETILKWTK